MATSRIFWSKIHIFSTYVSKDSPFSCDHLDGKVVNFLKHKLKKMWIFDQKMLKIANILFQGGFRRNAKLYIRTAGFRRVFKMM